MFHMGKSSSFRVAARRFLVVQVPLLSGVVLLCINSAGLFMSLRNNDILHNDNSLFVQDITLSYDTVLEHLSRRQDEIDEAYAVRLAKLIHDGLAHYWADTGIKRYNLRVPVWENYLLFIAQYVMPSGYRKYEFINTRKAIERGVGLCSQHAMVLSDILHKNDIASSIINLEGHVVVQAVMSSGEHYILDSDYGVVMPYSIHEIEENPAIVEPFYTRIIHKLRIRDNTLVSYIRSLYEKEGNRIYTHGVREYMPRKYYLEKISYGLKWVIPLVFILLSFYGARRQGWR